jgi:glycosyltransferase involved in cell wall biosynthesis
MRLLVLTNNPERASFRQRIGVYVEMLGANGVACSVEQFPSGLWARYQLLRSAGGYDAVFLHKRRLNAIDAKVLRGCARRIIYDFDDAVMYSDKEPEREDGARMRRFSRTVGMADAVIAGNEYLAEHARRYNKDVHVVPTGLAVDDYVCEGLPEGDGKVRLVWIGSKSTLGYLRMIAPALEEVGRKYDNVVLRIICDEFFDLEDMPVERCVWSQEGQAYELGCCDTGLAPLPDDRFTRGKCGFKILQYAAAGIGCVASPVGVNRSLVEEGGMGFAARDEAEWVERLSQLVEDGELRARLGQAGREYVRKYDVEAVGKRLPGIIKGVV